MGSLPGKFHEKADEQLKPNFVTEVFKENYTTSTTNILIKYCNKKEVKPYDNVFIVRCSSKPGVCSSVAWLCDSMHCSEKQRSIMLRMFPLSFIHTK